MNHAIAARLLVACLACLNFAGGATAQEPSKVPMSERIAILHQTYPDLIYSVTKNTMRLMSNRSVVIDDGRQKNHLAKRRDADIEDQLSQIYPMGRCYRGRRRDADPGLIRSEQFLRVAYGKNEHQVSQTSELVDWFGTEVRFSNRHGAATALRRVAADLKNLPADRRKILEKAPRKVLDWSKIPFTERLSVHSFGIAIDLDAGAGTHWRRAGAKIGKLRRFRNRVHPLIIAVFEKHGFIWGGKWYRFESNHFEYRPAMIAIGNLALQRGCEAPPKRLTWKAKTKSKAAGSSTPR